MYKGLKGIWYGQAWDSQCVKHMLFYMIQGGHPVYHLSSHLCSEDAGAGSREEGGGLCCQGKQG